MNSLTDKVCFIRAKLKNDYVYDGIVDAGYEINTPYIGNALIPRVMREIWFRCNLPHKDIWFNKKSLLPSERIIIVRDPLITQDYLKWLREKKPDAVIIVEYENRASNTLNPDQAKQYVNEMWSYDMQDCNDYGLRYKHFSFADKGYNSIKGPVEYDILFVGRDKGRADKLFELQKSFESLGLKVLMYICADRKFLRFKKKYYRKLLNYDEYLNIAGKSRAILNIMPEGQRSITQRDLEAVVYNLKEITNNCGIRDFEYYDPDRFFVIGEDDLNKLADFVRKECPPVPEEKLAPFKDSTVMREMLKEYL